MATKKVHSSAKAVVTTEKGNVEVNKKSGELLEAFDKFQAIHEAFHKELIDTESVLPISVRTSGPIARKLRNLANWY